MSTSNVISGLGGYTVCRHPVRFDYTLRETVNSLLEICEQVVVADSDSNDGARELLDRWAEKEPRLKVVNYPWTKPRAVSHHFFVAWLNFARQHLTTPFQLTLDCDEILHDGEECRTAVLEAIQTSEPARWFTRNNYWKSPRLMTPHVGGPCADRVVRLGFTKDLMVSDQPVHPGTVRLIDTAIDDSQRLLIHHVGFLRETKAFYRKARAIQDQWWANYDRRLEDGERKGIPLHETECEFTHLLRPYSGTYPKPVIDWFRERGHLV